MESKRRNYLYDILSFWLCNENNEYYILNTINLCDEVFEIEDLDLLIISKISNACKEKLKNNMFVDINYLRYLVNVFNTVIKSSKYQKTNSKSIANELKELNDFIKSGNYKDNRKEEIFELINLIGTDIEYSKMHQVDAIELEDQMKLLNNQDAYSALTFDSSRTSFAKDVIISENNSNCAYSIDYKKDGSTLLRIHIFDLTALIPEYSQVDHEFCNEYNLKDVDFNFEKDKESPSITFQLNVDTSGNIYDLKAYKSLIKPTIVLDDKQSYKTFKKNYELQPLLVTYSQLLHKHKNEENSYIFDYFNKVLMEEIGRKIDDLKIPFVYQVQEEANSEEFAYQLTHLNWFFFRIDDALFKKLYHILCNKQNTKVHYSLENIGHYSLNRKVQFDLFKSNYVSLMIQRFLIDMYINEIPRDELIKIYGEDFTKIINYYNRTIYDYNSNETMMPKQFTNK